MATVNFSTNLALALPTTGDLSGTWGTETNSSITNMLDEALGYQAFTATGGTDTLTIPNGTTGVARSIYIQLNGTGGGTVNVPTTKTKMYFVFNNTASAITFKVTGQTGVSIPASAKISLVSNGTDIIIAQNYFPALTLGAALPVASGGTGTTSTTFANLTTNVTGTLPIVNGGTGTSSTTFANLTTNVTGLLPVVNGGTATATPSLVQGSNITITGTWPNQTIAAAAPGTGTVTSVAGTGTVNGISLSGTVTSSGSLTLGGTLSGVANAALTNSSVTVTAGTGMSGGGAVALGSSVTLTNAGVTSVTAGTGISVSAATGGVTISSTASGGQAFVAFGSTGGF